MGDEVGQDAAEAGFGAGALACAKRFGGLGGEQVDGDGLSVAPDGGDLEDRGAGKAAMGDDHALVETGGATLGADGEGDAG